MLGTEVDGDVEGLTLGIEVVGDELGDLDGDVLGSAVVGVLLGEADGCFVRSASRHGHSLRYPAAGTVLHDGVRSRGSNAMHVRSSRHSFLAHAVRFVTYALQHDAHTEHFADVAGARYCTGAASLAAVLTSFSSLHQGSLPPWGSASSAVSDIVQ